MKTFFLFFISISLTFSCLAQKPALDQRALEYWPTLTYAPLSENGKYAMYGITAYPQGEPHFRLVIQSTDNGWHDTIDRAMPPFLFSSDNSKSFYMIGDSLVCQTLGTSNRIYIKNVRSFSFPNINSSRWGVFILSDTPSNLNIIDLNSNSIQTYRGVTYSQFSNDGQSLLLLSKDSYDSLQKLKWVNLQDGRIWPIWNGREAYNFQFDRADSTLSFLSHTDNNHASMWVYNRGESKPNLLIDGDTLYAHQRLTINNIVKFNSSGNDLQFTMKKSASTDTTNQKNRLVIVWKYSDLILPPQQNTQRPVETITGLVDLNSHAIQFIQQDNETLLANTHEFSLIMQQQINIDYSEWYWNPAALKKFFLRENQTGKTRLIAQWNDNLYPSLSPDGKFVIYFDPVYKNYFSYECGTGLTHALSALTAESWIDPTGESPDDVLANVYPNGWLPEENAVLLTGRYDIWKIDCKGMTQPINLTRGIRKNRHWIFKLASNDRRAIIHSGQSLLLSVFDDQTKQSGLYSVAPDGSGYTVYQPMGNYVYDYGGFICVKDSACIFTRMSASSSPNFFFTLNFKSTVQLSHLTPEKNYNWLTAELVDWKNSDGSSNQGILYKPENFDPHKKYPLIFYYYERLSDNLNRFIPPGFSDGPMDIPWIVSNGYLVFTPDIHYTLGQPGKSAFDAIMSAARLLSQKSFVDKDHMGLQGHSFGGYETNYIVTHTSLFAAACSAAGLSDLTAQFGTIWERGASRQGISEKGQIRMNSTPWQKKDLYISNSPIYFVDKVTTPILLVHNRLDDHVDFNQGVSFFMALRRLQKKAWMLEYPGERHLLDNKAAAIDLNRRMTEFFDHYLKNAPMPSWMQP